MSNERGHGDSIPHSLNEDTGTAYLTPWPLGEPPCGGGVGKVVQSRSKTFQEGDIVESFVWPWQEFVVFSSDNPNVNRVCIPQVYHPQLAWSQITKIIKFLGNCYCPVNLTIISLVCIGYEMVDSQRAVYPVVCSIVLLMCSEPFI